MSTENVGTTLNNTPPWFTAQGAGTVAGNTSITITATATDNEQANLNYTLNYGTSTSYGKTKTASKAKGQPVTFNLTASDGINNYTTYYFRVDVTDGIAEPVKGNPGSAKTWCGLATQCSGKVNGQITCGICNGNKTVTSTTNCSSCGGTGGSPKRCGGSHSIYSTSTETMRCAMNCGGTSTHYYAKFKCNKCGNVTSTNYGQGQSGCNKCGALNNYNQTATSPGACVENAGFTTCNSCGGTGKKTITNTCGTCSGTGKVNGQVNCRT